MGRLDGKRVFATAAGQGIGRATALAMAAEGASVTATDIDAGLLATLDHPGIVTAPLDVRDGAAVTAMVAQVRPDIVFNCAGFVHDGTLLESTDDEWALALDLNLASMVRTIRAALPGMIDRGQGSIVNMASAASSIIGAPRRAVYGTTKAAVIGLTKAVAADHIAQGIRVNAICPGTVDSPSLHDRLAATGDYHAAHAAFVARQKMGRLGRAEEIAALAVYLASDDSAFMTGQAVVIDGGWSG